MERDTEQNEITKTPEQALVEPPRSHSASRRAHGTDLTGVFRQVAIPERSPEISNTPSPTHHEDEVHSATDIFGTIPPSQSQDEAGFTQIFQSLNTGIARPQSTGNLLNTSSSSPRDSQPIQSSGGEFTQLFRKLDEAPRKDDTPMPSPSIERKAPPDSPPLGGGFTQLLRTLSRETNEEVPIERPQPAVQQATQAPGEFTQIISRSALREAQQTRHPAEPGPVLNPTPIPPSPPAVEAQSPPISPQNILANAQSLASIVGTTPPSIVTPPVVPTVPSAPIPQQTQPNGRLQQYLPLLFIGNLFLMLIILVLVVFLLLRGH